MKALRHHLAAAHIWLFRAGFDPKAVDVNGLPLTESLAFTFGQFERDGRREAMYQYLENAPSQRSGRHLILVAEEDEITGVYNRSELERLVAATKENG